MRRESDEAMLVRMKKEFDGAKSALARKEGELDSLAKRMKEAFGVEEIARAERILKKKKRDLEDMERKHIRKMDEVKQAYERLRS